MQRRILIVDDHDDLAGDLRAAFTQMQHSVTTLESRDEAVHQENLADYDVLIIDLDDVDEDCRPVKRNGSSAENEIIKAFKLSASNFRNNFDENELKQIVETTLDYKSKFIDDERILQNCREKIEFELPSAISPMHSILSYLLQRVAKMGVICPEKSNVFVALDEAFVNAVKHGNRFNHEKLVRITADVSPKEARFTVEDEGEGFDVTQIPDPLDPANLFKTSGRGVLLMYNIMDEVKYNERGNQLTLVKKPELVSQK
ncbi:MAG: ATP-binding protein [Acidobacteriota bacterium]|nr:ATP-binding protein [Acidobacteriota bacterium]